MDTNRPRIVALLHERHPKALCAKCIGTALGMRPSAAQRVATMLEGMPGFARQHSICGICGQGRLTVRTT